MKVEKICKVCGKIYSCDQGSLKLRKTCSKECKYILLAIEKRNKRIIKKCIICNTEFAVPKCHSKREVCSKNCKHKLHSIKMNQKIEKECKICRKIFLVQPSRITQEFCSFECYKHSSKKSCPICGKEIYLDNTTCSRSCMAELYKEILRGQNNPNWKGGEFIRENSCVPLTLRFEILKRDSHKCCECGTKDWELKPSILHIHHRIPLSKGGLTEKENLETLCFICHYAGKHNYSLNEAMLELAKRSGCTSRYLS